MKYRIRTIGMAALVILWALLAVSAWFLPDRDLSESERRPLTQVPELTAQSLLKGSFMKDFEKYTLDQFPGRDAFRKIKSLFHFYVLNQSDNNDIYLADGYAVKQEYPLNPGSIHHAADRFNYV